jgi:hypothetical protein
MAKENDPTEQVNVFMLIKVQAMIRGMLARKRVKAVYGYSMKPGLVGRKLPGTVNIEMDPQKLEEQRQKVQEIKKLLPAFEYGIYEDEDNEPEIEL